MVHLEFIIVFLDEALSVRIIIVGQISASYTEHLTLRGFIERNVTHEFKTDQHVYIATTISTFSAHVCTRVTTPTSAYPMDTLFCHYHAHYRRQEISSYRRVQGYEETPAGRWR